MTKSPRKRISVDQTQNVLGKLKDRNFTAEELQAALDEFRDHIRRTGSRPIRMEFAREFKRLQDEGWHYLKIARMVRRSGRYVRDYIRLVEKEEANRNHS